MKKIMFILFTFSIVILSGCSVLEEVNSSLNYATESTDYINDLQTFGEEASSLVQDAATDPDKKTELEGKITDLEARIKEFNEMKAPSIATDLHETVVEKNDQILEGINTAKENGELSVEKLKDTEIFKTINEMTDLIDQIKQLEL
ncbi:hypothetical protein CR203_14885 [Salipaludibacillus neizhouensis]|uniref:Lipoprotein n=1 Tax=Salipaludibacillus neizhouensis TaxID=885475 RepID=A0A3A9K6S5_9BACI|nr:DUF6376 family protein [Salipaludibacillus neizhouensis]RKL66570.1 hypothetical protein CR203_14885 [Salipaludibacillus neizhouensis]